MRPLALLLTIELLFSLSLPTQDSRASLSGTVLDQSGAAVAGAALKLLHADTSVALTTTSNEIGFYRFLFVNPGAYRLTVEQAGIRTFIRENVVLNVSQSAVFSSDPNLDPTSPNFGKIFRDNGQNNFPRNIQLGLRFTF